MPSPQISTPGAQHKEVADNVKALRSRLQLEYELLSFIPTYAHAVLTQKESKIADMYELQVLQPLGEILQTLRDWEARIYIPPREKLWHFIRPRAHLQNVELADFPKEEIMNSLDKVRSAAMCLDPSITCIIKAKERAANKVEIRRVINGDNKFSSRDWLDGEVRNLPVQKAEQPYRMLDRERKTGDLRPLARMRAIRASENFVRMLQLDEDEDSEWFTIHTGLLSCTGLVLRKEGFIWMKKHRRQWEELINKDPKAIIRLLLGKQPPVPPPLQHSIWINLPSNIKVKTITLRRMLDDDRVFGHKPDPVNRLRFARAVVKSMTTMFALGLHHRSIRPDNILVLEPRGHDSSWDYTGQIGMPYLIGFNQICEGDQGIEKTAYHTNDLRRDIYVNRPRLLLTECPTECAMIDDLYSLGITLIEILSWRSFFRFDEETSKWEKDEEMLDIKIEKVDAANHLFAFVEKAKGLGHEFKDAPTIIGHCLTCFSHFDSWNPKLHNRLEGSHDSTACIELTGWILQKLSDMAFQHTFNLEFLFRK